MDFSYSESQQVVRDLARRIFEEQVSSDYLRTVEEGDYRHDPRLWQVVADAGLLGAAIPERYGGMGYGFGAAALVIEEAARVLAPLPLLGTLAGGSVAIGLFGSDAQKKEWLGGIATGETVMSVGLNELANLDPYSPATTAVQKKGAWELSGSKCFVPFADISARVVLSAATGDGCALVMVDPGAKGVSLDRREGTAREPQFIMTLDKVRVSPDDVLCHGAKGKQALCTLVQHMLAGYCVMAVGVSEQMMRMTASYVSEREQFGVKIGTFQAVGHRAANCFIDTMCLRLTTEQAVSLLDRGLDAHRQTQVAKIWAGDVTHRVSYAAQHLHGGAGVDRDYALFRYCLWAKHLELALVNSANTAARMGAEIASEYLDKATGKKAAN